MMPKYDFLIVGGGIFGIYAALFLAEQHDQRVLLLEKETALLKKASVVNQARLHGGAGFRLRRSGLAGRAGGGRRPA